MWHALKRPRYVTCVLSHGEWQHACHTQLTMWHACCCLWFDDHVTCEQLTNSCDMRAVCTEHALSHLPFPPLQRTTQLILWTIRQRSCTREQICTCESFGQKYQNFHRYTFVPWYRVVGVWFTKSVGLCAAMREMWSRTAHAQTAPMSCDECFNRTSFCVWVKRTQI